MPIDKARTLIERVPNTGLIDFPTIAGQAVRSVRLSLNRARRQVRRRIAPLGDFAGEFFRSPRDMGAIFPSSTALARLMAEGLDTSDRRLVVELGAGTGNVTAALLEAGVTFEQLIVVERSELMARRLRRRFPGATIIQGDAAELLTLLGDKAQDVGAVVSSLPLRSLEPETVDKIVSGVLKVLGHNGRLIQFTYDLRNPSVPRRQALRPHGTRVAWKNLPPARVDVFCYRE